MMEKEGIRLNTLALGLCISPHLGVAGFVLRQHSLNSEDIAELISFLETKLDGGKAILFMDNVKMHKSKKVVEQAIRTGVEIIYNAPYSSQYHCIEEVFAIVKRNYRAGLIKANFKISEMEHQNIIINTIASIPVETIRKIHERHLRKMNEMVGERQMME